MPDSSHHVVQAAKAQSATAGLEAATACKLMADFRTSITAQVDALQQRQDADAAALVKVCCAVKETCAIFAKTVLLSTCD